MTRQTLRTLLVASLVLLAGCAGGIQGTPANGGGATDAGTTDGGNAGDGGTVALYISDERNAIDDFEHLNVTVSEVGFKHANGTWVERDVDNETVDLTELQGANATLLDDYEVPDGNYTTVFVHVSEINGTLTTGEQVNVKLPSEKLQVHENYTVGNGEEVEFVFDATVFKAGNSGKYILKPVVSESGTDVPIKSTGASEGDLAVAFEGNVTQGENATLSVTHNESAVANATVRVDGERLGTTDADGQITVPIPTDAEELEVSVRKGDREGELEVEFEAEDDDGDDERERGPDGADGEAADGAELNATFTTNVTQGETATLAVTRNGSAVENASVSVNGETVGRTNADGELTFTVPEDDELEVTVEADDETVELEREFESDSS